MPDIVVNNCRGRYLQDAEFAVDDDGASSNYELQHNNENAIGEQLLASWQLSKFVRLTLELGALSRYMQNSFHRRLSPEVLCPDTCGLQTTIFTYLSNTRSISPWPHCFAEIKLPPRNSEVSPRVISLCAQAGPKLPGRILEGAFTPHRPHPTCAM